MKSICSIYKLISYNADINECSEDANQCLNDAECENTIGSFICHCRYGWTGTRCETGIFCVPLNLSSEINKTCI